MAVHRAAMEGQKRRMKMSELAQAMKCISKLPTVIMSYEPYEKGYPVPGAAERFMLVGRVPYELTVPSTHGTPQIPPNRSSFTWDTEQAAVDALLALGITHFQMADCSWYDQKSAEKS